MKNIRLFIESNKLDMLKAFSDDSYLYNYIVNNYSELLEDNIFRNPTILKRINDMIYFSKTGITEDDEFVWKETSQDLKNKKEEMKESIKENGILVPIIVRKIENDKYEIISGHNRVECAKELGFSTIPSQIVDCDDEKATLIMLDTNLNNREKILPVDKGYAYKQRNNIIKNRQNNSNMNEFYDNSTEWNEEGKSQIYNYIRLTELIKPLQEKVNIEQIPIKAGVEISYLNKEEQEIVNQVIEDEQIKITVAQAQKVRLNKNNISYETLLKIIKNEKVKVEKFTGK